MHAHFVPGLRLSTIVVGLIAALAPQTVTAAVAPAPVTVQVHLQVPFVGGHEPIGLTSIGGDLGVQFYERWAMEGRLTYGTDLSGTGWTTGGAFGAYWTLYDGRKKDRDRVGPKFAIPTLIALEYVDVDFDCRGQTCNSRLSTISPGISLGVQAMYWTKLGFGLHLRLLLTGSTAIWGTVTDNETGAESDMDDDQWYGSSGRLTFGIAF